MLMVMHTRIDIMIFGRIRMISIVLFLIVKSHMLESVSLRRVRHIEKIHFLLNLFSWRWIELF